MTTKDQERKALAQIRKIVEDLGPDSYIGIAFEGCFDIAAQNIDNDWGCSLKQETASLSKTVKQLESKLDEAIQRRSKDQAQTEALQKELDSVKAKTLGPDDLYDCKQMAEEVIFEAEQIQNAAAAQIVQYADAPDSKEFKEAVMHHRNAKGKVDYYKALAARIKKNMG